MDAKAAASADVLARLFTELGVTLEKPAAEAIYTGLRTDTGGFRFRNVSPEAHELVADLLRAGVVPAEVDDRLNRTGTIEQLNVVGVTLANAVRHGEAIIATVDNDDYERTGGTELDSKESIDHLRTVSGVDVVAHLREVPEGTKGSLRSERMDVAEIARGFGGGGHRLAAGYTAKGKRPQEAKEELLEALRGVVDLGEKLIAQPGHPAGHPVSGALLVDKPKGITSARAVALVKRHLPKKTKIGHTGTLDPWHPGCWCFLSAALPGSHATLPASTKLTPPPHNSARFRARWTPRVR